MLGPYIAVYFMIREILNVFPDLVQLDMGRIMNYGWLALAGIVANILLYFLAIFSSHIAAFGTLYDLKVLFADHITKIPLGYHLTIGSGRLRKIMDENIESVEGFIAHQFPDFVASITAPIVMVIILFVVDWRFGLASLAGIILAFIAEFIGFGSGAMKENMGKYQKASEEMNNASVEYVRGMSVVKAFNQTASSFKKLQEAISGYTEWVLKFSLGWQNCMPAFTTIINNIDDTINCIDSIKKLQELNNNYKILLVDNKSPNSLYPLIITGICEIIKFFPNFPYNSTEYLIEFLCTLLQ